MAIAAVDLVCDLTNICNEAGQWIAQGNDPLPGQPNSYPASQGSWSAWGNRYVSDPETGCKDSERITANVGPTSEYVYDHMEQVNADTYKCFARSLQYGSIFYASNTSRIANCATGYQLQASNCVKTGVTETHPATANDWANKENLLNDDRFIPELIDKDESLPVDGIPFLTPGQKQTLGVESKPTRDAQGNVTGRQETTTEIEAVDAATAEAPGKVIIKETSTTVKYDNNNVQISSETTTNYTQQPQPENKQQTWEIKFDEVTPAELPTHAVQASFSHTSWGDGSCPPDIPISISYYPQGFVIPTQPVCETAENFKPFVLLLAAIASIYIVAGVRSGEPK